MKQYPADVRERLLDALDAGLDRAAATRAFGVPDRTIRRWAAARRATGSARAKPRPGPLPRIAPDQYPALAAPVAAAPDATRDEHRAAWAAAHGVRVSRSTMGRTVRRLGLTVKKKR